mmetsp:Transcript_68701/g.192628  ORF Transcript_68701/g.192628 Transcript_68701/m.192628 type:complete len:261 (+) Transcript_68701:448-1230(+)
MERVDGAVVGDLHAHPHRWHVADLVVGSAPHALHDSGGALGRRHTHCHRGGLAREHRRAVARPGRRVVAPERPQNCERPQGCREALAAEVRPGDRPDHPAGHPGCGWHEAHRVHLCAVCLLGEGGLLQPHRLGEPHAGRGAQGLEDGRLVQQGRRGLLRDLWEERDQRLRPRDLGVLAEGVCRLHVCLQLHRHVVVHGLLFLEHRHLLVAAYPRVRDHAVPLHRPAQPEEDPAAGPAPHEMRGLARRLMDNPRGPRACLG